MAVALHHVYTAEAAAGRCRWFISSGTTPGVFYEVVADADGGPFAVRCSCPHGRRIADPAGGTYPNARLCRHLLALRHDLSPEVAR